MAKPEFGKAFPLSKAYKTADGHEITEVTLQPPCWKHMRSAMQKITEADQLECLLSELSGLAPEELGNMRARDVNALIAVIQAEAMPGN